VRVLKVAKAGNQTFSLDKKELKLQNLGVT
jgi:hypothetical protein